MRFHSKSARAFAWVFVLLALGAAPSRLQAQTDEYPVALAGQGRHHLSDILRDFHARQAPIPRTYSYLYANWFNQPRHFRVVGPDGKTYWRTTVRGLPLGTPWPSDGVVGAPPWPSDGVVVAP
jgi:hypothetical protein